MLACLLLTLAMSADARASGRTWVVDKASPRATDDGPGDEARPFKTISAAAFVAEPGDTVCVHAGVYRERVAPRRGGEPGRPITYEAAPRERVVIKASDLWQPDWQPQGNGLYLGRFVDDQFDIDQRHAVDWPSFPQRYNPFVLPLNSAPGGKAAAVDPFGNVTAEAEERNPAVVGELFVNGQPLLQLPDATQLERTPGSWRVADDASGLVVHPPTGVELEHAFVELVTRPRCFAPYKRGLSHITVRGFVMEHGANDFPRGFYGKHSPQAGILSTRGGTHWVIESNSIRFGTSLGLDIGTEGTNDGDGLGQPQPEAAGYHIVRNNIISDNGCGGIAGIRSYGSQIVGNTIERNNRLGFTAPEISGIKLHFFVDGLIEGNLLRDNDAYGIWLDNVYHRSRVTRNVIVDNQRAGLFIELGHGPLLVDHNVIALTRSPGGYGVYSHDASGVTFAHNLVFFNAGHGLWAHAATDRKPGLWQDGKDTGERRLAEASNWTIVNNLFVGSDIAVALPP
ncbi:MAG: right-handed parallel beta-helix repeat-containing protein, partial [Planctomycetota bacterium]